MLQSIRFGYFLVIVAFIACGDTDDNSSTNAMMHWVGQWKFSDATPNDSHIPVVEFRPDGTYGHVFYSVRTGKPSKLQLLGTYSVTEDTFEFIDHLSKFERRVRSRGTWTMPNRNTLELRYDHDHETVRSHFRVTQKTIDDEINNLRRKREQHPIFW